jgi:hypothetical protein
MPPTHTPQAVGPSRHERRRNNRARPHHALPGRPGRERGERLRNQLRGHKAVGIDPRYGDLHRVSRPQEAILTILACSSVLVVIAYLLGPGP